MKPAQAVWLPVWMLLSVGSPAFAQDRPPGLIVDLLPAGLKLEAFQVPPIQLPAPASGQVSLVGREPRNPYPKACGDTASFELAFTVYDPNDAVGKQLLANVGLTQTGLLEQVNGRFAEPQTGPGADTVHPVEVFAFAGGQGRCQRSDALCAEQTGPNSPTHMETYFNCSYVGLAGVTLFDLRLANVPKERANAERWFQHVAGRLRVLTIARVAAAAK